MTIFELDRDKNLIMHLDKHPRLIECKNALQEERHKFGWREFSPQMYVEPEYFRPTIEHLQDIGVWFEQQGTRKFWNELKPRHIIVSENYYKDVDKALHTSPSNHVRVPKTPPAQFVVPRSTSAIDGLDDRWVVTVERTFISVRVRSPSMSATASTTDAHDGGIENPRLTSRKRTRSLESPPRSYGKRPHAESDGRPSDAESPPQQRSSYSSSYSNSQSLCQETQQQEP